MIDRATVAMGGVFVPIVFAYADLLTRATLSGVVLGTRTKA